MKLTANQFVLLAALREKSAARRKALPHRRVVQEAFSSQRAWLSAASALYLERWPGGSNAERGPKAAIKSLVRKRWVTQTWRRRSLVPTLTTAGSKVLAATDPNTVRPKHVLDVLHEMRRPKDDAMNTVIAETRRTR